MTVRVEGADFRCTEGRDGWLFVTEFKGLDLLRLYRDPAFIPPSSYDEWAAGLRSRRESFAAAGTAYATLFVPDNLWVYPDKLPPQIALSSPSPAERLLSLLDPETAAQTVYVRPQLIAGRERAETCRATDTHWTDWGAYLGYLATMETLTRQMPGLEVVPEERLVRSTRTSFGDLGATVERAEPVEVITVADDHIRLVDAVRTHTRETCSVFEQDRPDLPTAVVFRDSAMSAAAKYFSQSFRRIVYVASPSTIYDDLIERERPDVVIHELAERRIFYPPTLSSTVDYRHTYAEFELGSKAAADLQRKARTLLTNGDPEGALRAHDDLLAQHPPAARTLMFRGEAYVALNDVRAAIEVLSQATSVDPHDGYAHFLLGTALNRAGSGAAAEVAYTHALEAEPRHLDFWLSGIRQASANEAYDRAAALAERAAERFPAEPVIHRLWASVLVELRRVDEAAGPARTAYALMPDDDGARRLLLGVLTQLAAWEEVEPLLTSILAETPDDSDVRRRLALVRQQLGLWSDALPLVRELAEEEAPGETWWAMALVGCLKALGMHDEALAAADRIAIPAPAPPQGVLSGESAHDAGHLDPDLPSEGVRHER